MQRITNMSKQQLSTKIPANIQSDVADFKEENNITKSEAARQLLARGVDEWRSDGEEENANGTQEPPGETLMRQASTISIVLAVVSGMLIVMPGGPAWSVGAAMAGVASTTIFGVLWLGVRVLAGRGDWV